VVLEALKGEKHPGQIAKAYRVHPNSVGIWKRWFVERGPSVFEQGEIVGDSDRRVAELEQLLGKKEVELASLGVRMSILERDHRIFADPRVFYVTPHYKDYTSVLARIQHMSDAALRELLQSGYEFVLSTPKRARPLRRR